ncbi:MAG: hypothetical protein OXI86_02630, partial [Candidatus Poribacteria bacterium]|nr:hypothetical protein [Candidatus Poribacteria bacterium]
MKKEKSNWRQQATISTGGRRTLKSDAASTVPLEKTVSTIENAHRNRRLTSVSTGTADTRWYGNPLACLRD